MPWQNGITNLERLINIKKTTKLNNLNLLNITEEIKPEIVADFVKAHLGDDDDEDDESDITFTKIRLDFKVPPSDTYKSTVMSLLPSKVYCSFVY